MTTPRDGGVVARAALIVLLGVCWVIVPAWTAESHGSLVLEEAPRFGLYYDRYEPAFYTGFAPR